MEESFKQEDIERFKSVYYQDLKTNQKIILFGNYNLYYKIRKYLVENNKIIANDYNHKVTKLQQEIISEFKNNKPVKQIAEEYNLNINSVRNMLYTQLGSTRTVDIKYDKKDIVNDYMCGMKQVEIAKKYGCTRQYVNTILKKKHLI